MLVYVFLLKIICFACIFVRFLKNMLQRILKVLLFLQYITWNKQKVVQGVYYSERLFVCYPLHYKEHADLKSKLYKDMIPVYFNVTIYQWTTNWRLLKQQLLMLLKTLCKNSRRKVQLLILMLLWRTFQYCRLLFGYCWGYKDFKV